MKFLFDFFKINWIRSFVIFYLGMKYEKFTDIKIEVNERLMGFISFMVKLIFRFV